MKELITNKTYRKVLILVIPAIFFLAFLFWPKKKEKIMENQINYKTLDSTIVILLNDTNSLTNKKIEELLNK